MEEDMEIEKARELEENTEIEKHRVIVKARELVVDKEIEKAREMEEDREIEKHRVIVKASELVVDEEIEEARKMEEDKETRKSCRYEGRRYQEGASVITSEPCLQCRCIEGALRCRLRVCPRLPNPPPSGCRVRPPGENVCCAELVCSDTRDSVNILRRSNAHIEQEEKHEEDYQTSRFQGKGLAINEGSIR
ncbi:uncharacterized protein LOC144474464 [Augochlora pura]